MAVIIDIGEEKDIHPKNKQDVGHRLALVGAGERPTARTSSTRPDRTKAMKVEGDAVRADASSNVGGGLDGQGRRQADGFAVAGEDHKFVLGRRRDRRRTVVVCSDGCRSRWRCATAGRTTPMCNLYNKAGLPASPFRTDDWKGITADAR